MVYEQIMYENVFPNMTVAIVCGWKVYQDWGAGLLFVMYESSNETEVACTLVK